MSQTDDGDTPEAASEQVEEEVVATPTEALRQIEAEEPPTLELANYLAANSDRDVVKAQDEIYAAIDSGALIDGGDGYGGLRLAEEEAGGEPAEQTAASAEQPSSQEQPSEEPGSDDPQGGENTAKTRKADPQEQAETATGAGEQSAVEYIDDPDFSGTVPAVREYYSSLRSVYERFGDLDGAPTTGFVGNSG